MKLEVKYPESFSRKELLLRSFFGIFYIYIPHMFILSILSFGLSFVHLFATISIVFSGEYPKGMYNYTVNLFRWLARVHLRFYNLADGYPAFGLDKGDDALTMEFTYPEKIDKGSVIIRFLFGGFYVGIPHMFLLMFRMFANSFVSMIGFFSILFTGKYPKGMFEFSVGTLRWMFRVNEYMYYISDTYPPFSGKPLEQEQPVDVL